MNERPILFSGAMVRALLAGTKTQTRRVVKLPPGGLWVLDELRMYPDGERRAVFHDIGEGDGVGIRCPYGAPGDRLWVRETWAAKRMWDDMPPSSITTSTELQYLADGPKWPSHGKTRVSIHMPQWASRLTLAVESVRVERLCDISEEDARAEGFVADDISRVGVPAFSARGRFRLLWEEINGAESWQANPWVWVVEFSRVSEGGGR